MKIFKDSIAMYQEQIYNKSVSSKILDLLDKMENDEGFYGNPRRWVWELLQNAIDVRKQECLIEIKLTEEYIEFKHNGKLFTVVDILSILNQVSSKSREGDSIGRYGTGFATTYLLSDHVILRGYVKEFDEIKRFRLNIDRSSRDESKIYNSIQSEIGKLSKLDVNKTITDERDNMWTVFKYPINSAE